MAVVPRIIARSSETQLWPPLHLDVQATTDDERIVLERRQRWAMLEIPFQSRNRALLRAKAARELDLRHSGTVPRSHQLVDQPAQ